MSLTVRRSLAPALAGSQGEDDDTETTSYTI
jgi:hypothetical protein